MLTREKLKKTKRWVVKIGSALLTDQDQGLNQTAIDNLARQMSTLVAQDVEVVIVSSGSIAEGAARLGWQERPARVSELQAAAAVGQMGLIQAYETSFQQHQLHTAQILLTHDDLSDRKRYLNAKSTIRELLKLKVVPVINENDTVITDEIRFGDNDTLAALVANLVQADLLVILTVKPGLFDQDPHINPQAKLISQGMAGDIELEKKASNRISKVGRGGMRTKLRAASLAARSGAATIIAGGHEANILTKLYDGQEAGTLLLPSLESLDAKKQWLAGHLQMRGRLVLDDGAVKALKTQGRSLLAIGVTQVSGQFNRGEMVACFDSNGNEVARGLINYSAVESQKIMGKASSLYQQILGYVGEPELIHRDNLVVL